MKRILITGASSGLGLEVAKLLIRQHPLFEFYLTARETHRLTMHNSSTTLNKLPLDLSQPSNEFINSSAYKTLQKTKFDHILHAASPYYKTRLSEATPEELLINANVIGNELLLLTQLSKNLLDDGSLVVCGSMGSERYSLERAKKFSSVLDDDLPCSIHSMHKGATRDLILCLHRDFPRKNIIYTNLSGFTHEGEVEKNIQFQYMNEEDVAKKHCTLLLESTRQTDPVIDIVSDYTANRVELMRYCTFKPARLTQDGVIDNAKRIFMRHLVRPVQSNPLLLPIAIILLAAAYPAIETIKTFTMKP